MYRCSCFYYNQIQFKLQISTCLVPDQVDIYEHAWSHGFLCIAAHSILTCTPFLALVAAAPTVFLVRHRVHTLPLAANLRILALVTTHATVESVCYHIHTLLLAAIWSGAANDTTNPRVLVTCHDSPGLGQKAVCPS
jgi:hypothetical protein